MKGIHYGLVSSAMEFALESQATREDSDVGRSATHPLRGLKKKSGS